MSDMDYPCPVCGAKGVSGIYADTPAGYYRIIGHYPADENGDEMDEEEARIHLGIDTEEADRRVDTLGGYCPAGRRHFPLATMEQCQSKLDHILALLEQP